MAQRVLFQLVDSRSKHDFTVQQDLPKYLGVSTPEYQILPLLTTASEADEAVRRLNKAAGGNFFSHSRVVVTPAG